MRPVISIVIPSYNSYSNLIDWETRNNPNYFSEVEFIFIDSKTDNISHTYFSYLKNKYVNIKFISLESTIYEAMNCGISTANGDIIAFMGTDDTLNIELLSFIQYLKSSNFIYSNLFILDVYITSTNNDNFTSKRRTSRAHLNYPHHQSCFFNRKFLIRNDIKYDTSFLIFSDMDFMFNVLRLERPIHIDFAGINFAKGGKSTNGEYFFLTIKELFLVCKIHRKIFTKFYIISNIRLVYYLICNSFKIFKY